MAPCTGPLWDRNQLCILKLEPPLVSMQRPARDWEVVGMSDTGAKEPCAQMGSREGAAGSGLGAGVPTQQGPS